MTKTVIILPQSVIQLIVNWEYYVMTFCKLSSVGISPRKVKLRNTQLVVGHTQIQFFDQVSWKLDSPTNMLQTDLLKESL